MTTPGVTSASVPARPEGPDYSAVWVVLPTYNEIDNLASIVPAILAALPGAKVLIVDDNSPDGTGQVADGLAAHDPRIEVLHRPAKHGLGKAYIQGFQQVMAAGAQIVVQMDADWSHDPAYLPKLVGALESDVPGHRGEKPVMAIGSRYVPGGGVVGWGPVRKTISRGGSLFARVVLRLRLHDLTGGFKAYRRATLEQLPWAEIHAGGYVFQIETTFLGTRGGGRAVEIPITFIDRQKGRSKMSRRIVVEAFAVVLQLRWEELRGRLPGARRL
jgi:dolichol-phosphate mannosyltransferase